MRIYEISISAKMTTNLPPKTSAGSPIKYYNGCEIKDVYTHVASMIQGNQITLPTAILACDPNRCANDTTLYYDIVIFATSETELNEIFHAVYMEYVNEKIRANKLKDGTPFAPYKICINADAQKKRSTKTINGKIIYQASIPIRCTGCMNTYEYNSDGTLKNKIESVRVYDGAVFNTLIANIPPNTSTGRAIQFYNTTDTPYVMDLVEENRANFPVTALYCHIKDGATLYYSITILALGEAELLEIYDHIYAKYSNAFDHRFKYGNENLVSPPFKIGIDFSVDMEHLIRDYHGKSVYFVRIPIKCTGCVVTAQYNQIGRIILSAKPKPKVRNIDWSGIDAALGRLTQPRQREYYPQEERSSGGSILGSMIKDAMQKSKENSERGKHHFGGGAQCDGFCPGCKVSVYCLDKN